MFSTLLAAIGGILIGIGACGIYDRLHYVMLPRI